MLYLLRKSNKYYDFNFSLTRPGIELSIYRNSLMRFCQYSLVSVYSGRQCFYDVIFDHICMVIYFLGYTKLLYTLINWGVVLSKQNSIMFDFVFDFVLFFFLFFVPFFFSFWFCLLYVCIFFLLLLVIVFVVALSINFYALHRIVCFTVVYWSK